MPGKNCSGQPHVLQQQVSSTPSFVQSGCSLLIVSGAAPHLLCAGGWRGPRGPYWRPGRIRHGDAQIS